MKILLISPNFFHYRNLIIKHLKSLGHTVHWYTDRPYENFFTKILYRYYPKAILNYAANYFNTHINPRKDCYDCVLIIQGEGVATEFLLELRESLPNAKFIFYTWDNFRNKPKHIVENLVLYDRKLTFDHEDAKKYGLIYRPLFYGDNIHDLSAQNLEVKYDLSFIGTVHSDRLRILNKINDYAIRHDLKLFMHLFVQNKLISLVRCLQSFGAFFNLRHFITTDKLDQKSLKIMYNETKVVLDIEHNLQSGLTMRTIECLGAGVKLVTTNRTVLDVDFYKPENVFVIDRAIDLSGLDEFLGKNYSAVAQSVQNRYTLSTWVMDILGHYE